MKSSPRTYLRIKGECNLITLLSVLRKCSVQVLSFNAGNSGTPSLQRVHDGYIPVNRMLILCAASQEMVRAALNTNSELQAVVKLMGAVTVTKKE